jgi:hypothetical protein
VFQNVCKKEKIEVAFIGLGYDNEELIQLLMERGRLITNGKFDKLA